jgi:hypothetical protein
MAREDRRKCKCCLKLFRPDPRNRWRQRYCSAPRCRAVSKSASQARWQDRARGPEADGLFDDRPRCPEPSVNPMNPQQER